MRTVDSELGEDIIKSASTTVWKERRRCPGVQRTLIELMQKHYSSDKAELLEKKLLSAIKGKDQARFSKAVRKKNEDK
jgi:hypothetical protein